MAVFLALIVFVAVYVFSYGRFVHHQGPWSYEVGDDVEFSIRGPAVILLETHPILLITPLALGAVALGFLFARNRE